MVGITRGLCCVVVLMTHTYLNNNNNNNNRSHIHSWPLKMSLCPFHSNHRPTNDHFTTCQISERRRRRKIWKLSLIVRLVVCWLSATAIAYSQFTIESIRSNYGLDSGLLRLSKMNINVLKAPFFCLAPSSQSYVISDLFAFVAFAFT